MKLRDLLFELLGGNRDELKALRVATDLGVTPADFAELVVAAEQAVAEMATTER